MTTFTIDTGHSAPFDPLSLIPDWFRDIYPADADPSRVIHDFGYHLIGQTTNPRKLETVRKHTLANWRFLQSLAETHPGVFDEFICAYAERALSFD